MDILLRFIIIIINVKISDGLLLDDKRICRIRMGSILN